MAKSYGSLTVVDITDTATYIYYSANKDGSNPTLEPQPDSKYIGIYSGPPLEVPLPGGKAPAGTEWSKYAGEDGKGIVATLIEYQISDSGIEAPNGEWFAEVQETTSEKPYLWTRTTVMYSDNTTSISYSVAKNGEPGVGISSVITLYALSQSSDIPPEEKDIGFKTKVAGFDVILSVDDKENNVAFKNYNGSLGATKRNEQLFNGKLSREGSLITGVSGATASVWQKEIPSNLTPGSFLWTKTTTFYTDTSIPNNVSYSVSRIGEDGHPGAPGPTYDIESNQEEVYKFVRTDKSQGAPKDIFSFSPRYLTFSVYKKVEGDKKDDFRKELVPLTNESCSIRYFNSEYADWTELDLQLLTMRNIFSIWNDQGSLDLEQLSKDTDYATFLEYVVRKDGILQIRYKKLNPNTGEDVIICLKSIRVTYGSDVDMAKLALNADGIVASIQSTKLTFDANGLHVKNGGLDIVNKNDDRVFYADENGNLVLSGKLDAVTGTFGNSQVTGILSVGDTKNSYIAIDGEKKKIYSSNYSDTATTGFSLEANGTIKANSIILGTSATIKDYIKLGNNCYIHSPLGERSKFIIVKNPQGQETFSLLSSGEMILDDTASISTRDFASGFTGWKIDSDKAEFNNVTVRGTISSSVFEHGKVTTVGGTILVRPSAIIQEINLNYYNQIQITCKGTFLGFAENDFCSIGDDDSQVFKLLTIDESSGDKTIFTFEEEGRAPYTLTENDLQRFQGKVLVSYGQQRNLASGLRDSVSIAINSNSNSSNVAPNAISVFENHIESKNGKYLLKKKPVIVLGEMTGNGYGNLQGYGLYADNAYLKGQLIAEQDGVFYSGIHTSSKIPMPNGNVYFPEAQGKVGDILLWAGAASGRAQDIQEAPFKVDTYGNLYAGSGYFNGTIISNATITAAKIKTAEIEGWSLGDNSRAALTIKAKAVNDKAISFWKPQYDAMQQKEVDKEVMTLTGECLSLNIPLKVGGFIIDPSSGGSNNGSLSTGSIRVANAEKTQWVQLDYNQIILARKKEEKTTGFGLTLLNNTDGSTDFNFVTNIGEENEGNVLSLKGTDAYFYGNLYCQKNLLLGEKVSYKVVMDQGSQIGYDIYVTE